MKIFIRYFFVALFAVMLIACATGKVSTIDEQYSIIKGEDYWTISFFVDDEIIISPWPSDKYCGFLPFNESDTYIKTLENGATPKVIRDLWTRDGNRAFEVFICSNGNNACFATNTPYINLKYKKGKKVKVFSRDK